jgi:hypothetical protein
LVPEEAKAKTETRSNDRRMHLEQEADAAAENV